MNISSFISISSKLPPHVAVLMRGSTGIGKSAITAQIAQNISANVSLVVQKCATNSARQA